MTSWVVLTLTVHARTANANHCYLLLAGSFKVGRPHRHMCDCTRHKDSAGTPLRLHTRDCSLSYSGQVTRKANGSDAEGAARPANGFYQSGVSEMSWNCKGASQADPPESSISTDSTTARHAQDLSRCLPTCASTCLRYGAYVVRPQFASREATSV